MPSLHWPKLLTNLLAGFFSLILLSSATAFDPVNIIGDAISESVISSMRNAVGQEVEVSIHPARIEVLGQVERIMAAAGGARGETAAIVIPGGGIRIWDLKNGLQRTGRMANSKALFLPVARGTALLNFQDSGDVERIDILDNSAIRLFGRSAYQARIAVGIPGTNLIAAGDSQGGVTLWDWKKGLRGARHLFKQGISVSALACSGEGHSLLAVGGGRGCIRILEIESGRWLADINSAQGRAVNMLSFLKTSAKGKLLIAVSDLDEISAWKTDGGPGKSWSTQIEFDPSAIAGDGDTIAIGGDKGTILLLDGNRGAITSQFKAHKGAVLWIKVLRKGSMILSIGADGELQIRESVSGEIVLRGITTREGWAVIDRNGRFDGRENAFESIQWLVKKMQLDLNCFARAYYEPGLLAKYVREDIPLITKALFDVSRGIPLPPTIEKLAFLKRDRRARRPTQVLVAARALHNSIEGIELYHNGKRVPESAKIVDRTKEQNKDGIFVRAAVYQVDPVSGKNHFAAVAVGIGRIEGLRKALSADFEGPFSGTCLRMASIGINRHSLERLNLRFAVQDARAVADYFTKRRRYFKEVVVTVLQDDQARRDNILQTLERIADETEPGDILVVFMAGHGAVVGQEWFLIPNDIPRLDDDTIKTRGISSRLLRGFLVNAKAQRILILMDSCRSGRAVSMFDRFLQKRIHREMGRYAGISILAASGESQKAYELEALDHGLFTSAVLSGLEGEADTAPPDALISAWELIDFADQAIPKLAHRYLEEVQTPVAYRGHKDFMVLEIP